jgi:hypothetical protein
MQDLTLVIGGTGNTGGRVAERLQGQGRPVRVGSRSGQPSFDWEHRTSWEPALEGAGRGTRVAREIAHACGGEISLVPVPIDAYATAAGDEDVRAGVLALLRYLFTQVLDGRNVHPTDGVERALGRPPRAFRDFAREAAASGIWRAP